MQTILWFLIVIMTRKET